MRLRLKNGVPFLNSDQYQQGIRIYDMYYLKDFVDRGKLMVTLDTYILSDATMNL